MAAKEGAAGLFAGLGVVLIGAAPAQALYFGGMTAVQQVYTPDSALGNFSAGFLAQLCGSISWVPMEVIQAAKRPPPPPVAGGIPVGSGR